MKILFVADYRSPIAHGWISLFERQGHDIGIVSTYYAIESEAPGDVPLLVAPLADFQGRTYAVSTSARSSRGLVTDLRRIVRANRTALSTIGFARSVLAPVQAAIRARTVREFVDKFRPNIIHALRIPYEGVLAARAAPRSVPLVVSIWGNDLTLHAKRNPIIRRSTLSTLQRSDGLVADCERDLSLASMFGFDRSRPALVAPGGGGVPDSFRRPPEEAVRSFRRELGVGDGMHFVLNPRGLRQYVDAEAFVAASIAVLKRRTNLVVGYLNVEGTTWIRERVRAAGVEDRFLMLPAFPHDRMPLLLGSAAAIVSPTYHDGTPNTLLEAMACGCFPIAGDIESVREWIDHGDNGLLVNPGAPMAIVAAIERALDDPGLRLRACRRNLNLIEDRASRDASYRAAIGVYEKVIEERAVPR